ncbi:hypothetical protein SCP_0106590 [Sparassis crispa]|uniref:Uncharacterized protein n=1 Tax=Sparassis crispa TaxID=139825 RepID=A0A401G6K0_9APHY|nr:hypothetical protein SCP_0106590 [Sparassis crispa]GBE77777.1 hypothetical protein SCP_0106590 [Sparassis crispa]
MLGSLFSSKSTNERKYTHQSPQQSPEALASTVALDDDSAAPSSSRPSMRRVVSALSTPHDAILAELHGRQPKLDPSAGTDASTTTNLPAINVGTVTSAGSLDLSDARNATASPAAQGVRSGATSSPEAGAEPIYDPFSGALLGVIVPHAPDSDGERADGGAQFDQAKDELWTHLSRIRELQNEIAGLHLQMEGVGLSEVRGPKRPPGPRVHSDTIASIDEWEGPAEAEEHKKYARDAELVNLNETFVARKAAIDGVMSKLDDLSKSLTTFHALPTPAMGFGTSRSNTKESRTTSPDPYDATSKATSTATSPPLPHQEPVIVGSPASYVPDSPLSHGDS